MKTTVVTQARMGSSRLPGKVLKKINDKSILEIHLNRIKKAKLVDDIIVATTTKEEDNVIEKLAKNLNINVFRGDEIDVLDRFYKSIFKDKPDFIVRLTSDCPLIDNNLIDQIISLAHHKQIDYVSNTLVEDFPDGQDIEVISYKSLKTAWQKANKHSEREHVTPYIRKNSDFYGKQLFRALDFKNIEGNFKNIRMTLDEEDDFLTLSRIISSLGFDKSWKEYTNFIINNPNLISNSNIDRNQGYLKSLSEDL